LRRFVALIDDLIRPNHPNLPFEVQWLLSGLAGFTVDMRNWGDYITNSGLFYKIWNADQINGTNILERCYILVATEVHVLDGIGNWSLNSPNPTPGWHIFPGI
jgi:hypothetical protein